MDAIVFAAYRDEVLPKPGVAAYLESLKKQGIPMAVATATNRPMVEAALARTGLASYFKQIFTCTEIGAGKERPDIYLAAAKALGTHPADTWVFEDALYAIKTAKAAGFYTVGFYDETSRNDQRRLPAWRTAMCGRFNLFPHKTVLENVMLAPVHVKKMEKGRAEALAKERIGKAGLADKVVFMADGRILEEGKPEEIFSNPKTPEARQFLRSVL
ncbi:MAG: HAD-IA family hydrolase [Roseburia hominis]